MKREKEQDRSDQLSSLIGFRTKNTLKCWNVIARMDQHIKYIW